MNTLFWALAAVSVVSATLDNTKLAALLTVYRLHLLDVRLTAMAGSIRQLCGGRMQVFEMK
jgi:hypothetical protein